MLLPGCSSNIKAGIGEQFTLTVKQTVDITGEQLSITFLDISDSRCPKGAQCIWPGEAKAVMEITDISGKFNLTLVAPGTSMNETQKYGNFVFTFKVEPYPEVDKPIAIEDYRLGLTVEKTAKN